MKSGLKTTTSPLLWVSSLASPQLVIVDSRLALSHSLSLENPGQEQSLGSMLPCTWAEQDNSDQLQEVKEQRQDSYVGVKWTMVGTLDANSA